MMITIIILVLIVLSLGFLIIRAIRRMKSLKNVTESEKILNLSDQNFSDKTKKGSVLVDFWAAWCMPCKLMVPVLNELSEDPNINVTIAKVNVDEAKSTASKFKVRSIPTMILFKNGQEIHRFVGVKTKDYLIRELDRRAKF